MENTMKAIIHTNNSVELKTIPKPVKAKPGHLLIKIDSCAINPGDKAFIHRPLPLGAGTSLYNVYGVSGAGKVVDFGESVPSGYKEKNAAIYRSLKSSENILGTWCEYVHVPFLDCMILPDDAEPGARRIRCPRA